MRENDNNNDEDKMALQRAIGRLEGRFGGLEARVMNLDTTTDRRLSSIVDRLEGVNKSLSELNNTKATIKGGWFTVSIFAVVISTLVGIGISIWNSFHR